MVEQDWCLLVIVSPHWLRDCEEERICEGHRFLIVLLKQLLSFPIFSTPLCWRDSADYDRAATLAFE